MFHTQSSPYLMHRLHDAVFAAPEAALADFAPGPAGERTVFALANVTAVTFNRQVSTAPTFSPEAGQLNLLRFDPGAVGTIAFGRYTRWTSAPIRASRSRPSRRARARQHRPGRRPSTSTSISRPARRRRAAGRSRSRGSDPAATRISARLDDVPARAARRRAHRINTADHGYGLLSTLPIARDDGPADTFPAGGRAIDRNGDGAIGIDEGFLATGARESRDLYDGYGQTAADLMQLVRVVQAGVDGDGTPDLDASRMSYWGWSIGSNYGIGFVAATPEITSAAFESIGGPALEQRRNSPVARGVVGDWLAVRTPAPLNSEYGLTEIDGVAVAAPFFNENQPLRDQPPVAITVPGAIAIRQ